MSHDVKSHENMRQARWLDLPDRIPDQEAENAHLPGEVKRLCWTLLQVRRHFLNAGLSQRARHQVWDCQDLLVEAIALAWREHDLGDIRLRFLHEPRRRCEDDPFPVDL